MSWTTVRVRPSADREAALAALFAAGALGVHEDGDALVTQVDASVDLEALTAAVRAADPGAAVETARLPDVDWTEAWKRGVRAHTVGALTVAPPWLAGAADPARTIVIEPEMAFGTGEHATTRGVLGLLQQVLRPGDRVADLGAGSAVLSIAAAKLGASRVAAIELDPDAIGNAEANVAANGVGGPVRVIQGDAALLLPLVAPVDLVLANILSSVIRELLPAIAAALAPGGRAIFSGIMTSERDEMRAALAGAGWRVTAEYEEEAWWSAAAVRA
ncbi:MAG: 50S ribosomal protein L11 methyltransferase [Gemmatimonadota bacterium]|nr:50S ribosomal protein L11 methyltransferase [Gemmatimonadota bacterium]MDE3126904.1 50S ribosomal protein L11 methyltransferase [Gemmatimonadota bacterium]MDE3172685.1 50S ribosomal protein L11 methyltransferase [Gemmatimonadota bacterium]